MRVKRAGLDRLGGKDGDAVLSLANPAAELLPGVEAGDVGRVRALNGDEEDIPEGVTVESGAEGQVRLELGATAGSETVFQLGEGVVD